ncbi:hypothetical protein FACS189472_00550 [Alphaproteobacteria bacterium]|nr:hypothetical protein FACS189472_00550 [Alphaproteobacteria bacterium]
MYEYVKYVIETIFGLAMFGNAALFIPQAIKIYKAKNADGVSVATFAGFNVIQIFTILHGYIHHDYILIFGNLLSLVFCATISVLIFLYKK